MATNEEHIDEIIDGCRNGVRKCQEQLYRNFYGVMVSICLRYTKNQPDAVSVLNLAFYKVFKNINQYDSKQAGIYTWIRTIVINTCLDQLKFEHKKLHTDDLSSTEDISMEPEIIEKIKQGAILNLVQKLPAATKAVFNLYVMEGYTHKEIGSLLHISDGTSKWHLSEAKKTLKQLILAQADD